MNVEENEEVLENVENPEENISEKKDVVDADELKQIKYYIEHCQGREEWKEVIKIVRKNLIKYTENSNGSFLNLSMMDSKTIEDIKQFIKFCQDNETHINTNEKKIEDEKIRLSTLVEETDSNVNEPQRESTTTFTNQNSNTKTYDTYSLTSLQSSIFEEYKEEEKEYLECESDENNEMTGTKINLKKYKKKYSGIKAKVLKRYKDISKSSAISSSVKVATKKNPKKTTTKKTLKKDYVNKTDIPSDVEEEEDDDDDDEDDDEEQEVA